MFSAFCRSFLENEFRCRGTVAPSFHEVYCRVKFQGCSSNSMCNLRFSQQCCWRFSSALTGYVTILGLLDPEDEEITTLITSQTIYPATQRKIQKKICIFWILCLIYTHKYYMYILNRIWNKTIIWHLGNSTSLIILSSFNKEYEIQC